MLGRAKKKVLYLEIGGNIPKIKSFYDIIWHKPSFTDIIVAILEVGRKADNFVGVFVDISPSNLTLSEIWEVKRALEFIKGVGKRVIGFLRSGGIHELFLADVCQRTFVPLNSKFFLTGFSSVLTATGALLKKLKIRVDAIKSGRLKSIPDMITKEDIPDELRRDMKRLLSEIKTALCSETSKFEPDIYFSGILSSRDLILRRAADVITQDTPYDIIKKEFGDAIDTVSLRKKPYLLKLQREKKIAVLNMFGIISENPSPGFISTGYFSQIISKLTANSYVDSVVVRINSRGGDAGVSENLSEKIKSMSREKRTVVSISSVGASGGYMLSLFANSVFSTPLSLVGSIGVFLLKPYISELMKWIGIKTEVMGEGKLSGMFSPYRELGRAEREELERFVQDEHENFIKMVSEGRCLPQEHVRKIADGSVFSGKRAKELKLVDDNKALSDILNELDAHRELPVEEYPKITLSDILGLGGFASFSGDLTVRAEVLHLLSLLGFLRHPILLSYIPLSPP